MPRRLPAALYPGLSAESPSALVRLWLLRLLVPLGGHREFIGPQGFSNDALAEALGLEKWIDPYGEFDPKGARVELRKLHKAAERKLRHAETPACLRSNVARLTQLVGLSEVDCRILEFVVVINNERLLDDTADWLGSLSSAKVADVLSVLLGLPPQKIRAALSPRGVLERSGLLSLQRNCADGLRGKLNLLSDNFADNLFSSDADPVSLLRTMVTPASAARLGMSDFGHLASSLSVLRPYLRKALADGRRGVNIFLYGAPGTGKTELTRTLAGDLGCELFEVATEDDDGDAVDDAARLRAFRVAQCFFAQRRAMILFDEVEDVFDTGFSFFGRRHTAQLRKGWINRTLEDNPVPALWLSNSVECLDAAFIRRFDMVIEMTVPPKRQRERIIGEACADLLDAEGVARLAESEALAPAIVTRAASVVRLIGDELGKDSAASAVELLVGNTLEAQGHQWIRRHDPNRLPEIYDPAFINADTDLAQLTTGLVQSKAGRLCLYGAPGTGKTAYGRWLARQLDAPLLVRRSSDLLSMWVGQAEKNIARAFRQAEREGAVLLIDEVDSFLQDRREAAHSWETTLVNEMLTQMESFPGVFIASTNLMRGLDQAALRRFDLKVKFDFLKPDQACELLCRHCIQLAITPPHQDQLARLTRLQNLAPGDFAAVVRQNRFRPIRSAADLVMALEAECAMKEGARVAIGFA